MTNREAFAYAIFRHLDIVRPGPRISPDDALGAVDEAISLVPGLRRLAEKKWRRPRERAPGSLKAPAETDAEPALTRKGGGS